MDPGRFPGISRLCVLCVLAAVTGGCGPADHRTGTAAPALDYTIYTHTLPDGREGTATGDFFTPAIEYPPIPVDEAFTRVLTFRMGPMAPPSLRPIPTHGPVVLYTDDMEVLVFSPLDHFFVSLIRFEDGHMLYGVQGEVEQIPPGFSHSFIRVRGRGLNATLERWGELLRAHHGRARVDRYADTGLATLGYWTDNGAYYYYRAEPGRNEEETLLAVKADADARGIPYGYMQLDSWWYFKDPGSAGLVRWEPIPAMFPEGLRSFQERLGLPLIAHNRWFAPNNDYRDRYEFVEGGGRPNMALPLSRGVFDTFMQDARSWGVFTYEQDWLSSQYWGIPYLRRGVGRAEAWMASLEEAAADQGLTLQLCMAGPAHLLNAVRMPSVTTVRTSIDYLAGTPKTMFWPQFHQVAMLAWAIGIPPFKDNFQSTPGQRLIFSEEYGMQEALISNLSAGMVGPGDRIGRSDAVLLGRTCRQDGLLLKPDRPATPLDAMFLDHERPYTTATWSEREGLGRWVYLAAYRLDRGDAVDRILDELFAWIFYGGVRVEEMFVIPETVRDWRLDLEADLDLAAPVVAYNWLTGEASPVHRAFELPRLEARNDVAYFVLAPVLSNGLALIGEHEKFVTLADRRFNRIEPAPEGIRIRLEGVPGEGVSLLAYDTRQGSMLAPFRATIGPQGYADVMVSR